MKVNSRWQILDKAFLSTVVTFMLIELARAGTGLIDSLATARALGSDAVAAVGLGFPLVSLTGMASNVIAGGMLTLCSAAIGLGHYRKYSSISSVGCFMGLGISILMTVLVMAFTRPIAVFLGARGSSALLLGQTVDYIRGLFIGVPALVFSTILAQTIQLDNGGTLVRVSVLCGAVIDVILDIAAIRMGMGLFGLGLASAVSYYVNLLLLLTHFLRKDRMLHLHFRFSDFREIHGIYINGSTETVAKLSDIVRPIIINNYILTIAGTSAMTVLSIKNTLFGFFSILGVGVSSAFPILVGVSLSERSREDTQHLGRLVHRYTLYGNGVIGLVAICLSSLIAKLYVPGDVAMQKMVVFSIAMIAIEVIAETLLVSRVAYLCMLSHFFECKLLLAALRLLVVTPEVVLFGNAFGMYGVLASFICTDVLLLFSIYVISAVKNKSFKVGVSDYMRLGDGFDANPGDIIELDIRDMDDAALVSEQVQMFCKGHAFNSRVAYFSALALEESSRLIYERNGFAKDLHIDVRIVIKDGMLVMRFRDNGKSSRPFEGIDEETSSDDGFANIGIRMIRKIAKDIRYFHSMNVNYTIISVPVMPLP